MFDVLGFRELIKTRSLESIAKFGTQFVQSAKNIRHRWSSDLRRRLDVRVFQDTVIAISNGGSQHDFLATVLYAEALLRTAMLQKLGMRGALTFGDVFCDRHMVIGGAISRVYEMEQQQEWIGCWVDECCVKRLNRATATDHLWDILLASYPIPLKAGPVKMEIAVNWVALGFRDERLPAAWKRVKKKSLFPRSTWDVMRKLQNTDRFVTAMLKLPGVH
jgi:hypothetical protein